MTDLGLGSVGRPADQLDELEGGDLPDVIQLASRQAAQLTKALAGRQGPQELGIARLVREMAWLLGDMAGRPVLQEQQMARLDVLMNDLTRLMNELPQNRG